MKTAVARQDPRRADHLNLQGGAALRVAAGNPKRGAWAAGVSERLFRNWVSGSDGSPVSRYLQLIASVPNPVPLLTAARVIAHQSRVHSMTDEALIQRFHVVYDEASAAEREQLQVKVMAYRTHDLVALRDASAREAALDEELAGIAGELMRRGLDPWE